MSRQLSIDPLNVAKSATVWPAATWAVMAKPTCARREPRWSRAVHSNQVGVRAAPRGLGEGSAPAP